MQVYTYKMATDDADFTYKMVVVTTPDGRNIWDNHENHEELEDWLGLVSAVCIEFPAAFPYELFLEVVWEPEDCAEKTSRAWGTKSENGHPGSGFLKRSQWIRCSKRQRLLESTTRFGSDPIKFIKAVCQRLAHDILKKNLNYGKSNEARDPHPRRGLFPWQARDQALSRNREGAGAQELLQEPVVSSGSAGGTEVQGTQSASPDGAGVNKTAPNRGGVGTPEAWDGCRCPICVNNPPPSRMDSLD